MDITSAFRGLSATPSQLREQIEQTGWELGKLDLKDGSYVGSATANGRKIEKTGPDEQTVLVNILRSIIRKHRIHSAALEYIGAEAPRYTQSMEEIAQEYAQAPVYDPKAAQAWKELGDDSLRRLDTLTEQIQIIPTPDPFPYATAADLREDVKDKRKLLVTQNATDHPIWSSDQVIAFRVVHDVMGYVASGADFGWQGECQAFEAHAKLLSHTAQAALFTETVGQAAAASTYNAVSQPKIAFLDAFEHPTGHPRGTHPSQTVAPVKNVHSRIADIQQVDPNQGWSSGIEPLQNNAYLWHGDPIESQNVMDNASLVDTGWSSFKREDGTPDAERMKQAIVNAFRVVLLSPRKDLRWNAVHYQDIAGVPAGVTDPKVYWDTLEQKRRSWNQAQGIDPNAHMIYYKFIRPFTSIVAQQHPDWDYHQAQEKASSILYEWMAQEQQRIEQEDAQKPAEKQRSADEIERRANEALARRLQQYIKDQYNEKTDVMHKVEQPNLFAASVKDDLKDAIRQSIDYGEGYVNDREKKVQIVLGDADDDNLFDRVRELAHKAYPNYDIEVGSEDYSFRVFRRDDYGKLEPNWHKIAAGEQYNLMTGEAGGKYGAFMGTHLKAIAQISQHADELLQAAQQDVAEHDASGHHFRAAVLQLGVPGVGPKVCSFAWLLLQPMTSQLATIDTHMMDVLGHDYDKEMNNRDYFKFERELAAGRDASGYGHVPLGAFQWGMWDYKRTGPGSHQDHSAMRVLDPVPHSQIDWASKAQNLKGESWHQQAPEWWTDTYPARQAVSQDWDENVAAGVPRDQVPYQTFNTAARLAWGRQVEPQPVPWYADQSGSVWTGAPGQTYAHLIRQVHGIPAHEYWNQPQLGSMGKYWPGDDRMVVATGEPDEHYVRTYLRGVLGPPEANPAPIQPGT